VFLGVIGRCEWLGGWQGCVDGESSNTNSPPWLPPPPCLGFPLHYLCKSNSLYRFPFVIQAQHETLKRTIDELTIAVEDAKQTNGAKSSSNRGMQSVVTTLQVRLRKREGELRMAHQRIKEEHELLRIVTNTMNERLSLQLAFLESTPECVRRGATAELSVEEWRKVKERWSNLQGQLRKKNQQLNSLTEALTAIANVSVADVSSASSTVTTEGLAKISRIVQDKEDDVKVDGEEIQTGSGDIQPDSNLLPPTSEKSDSHESYEPKLSSTLHNTNRTRGLSHKAAARDTMNALGQSRLASARRSPQMRTNMVGRRVGSGRVAFTGETAALRRRPWSAAPRTRPTPGQSQSSLVHR
jgi:hypothetical protein